MGAAVGELQALLESLERAKPERRAGVYAECLPLLEEIGALNRPPLPCKEVRALVCEAGWHLHALASPTLKGGPDHGEHLRWARQSLASLEQESSRRPEV